MSSPVVLCLRKIPCCGQEGWEETREEAAGLHPPGRSGGKRVTGGGGCASWQKTSSAFPACLEVGREVTCWEEISGTGSWGHAGAFHSAMGKLREKQVGWGCCGRV